MNWAPQGKWKKSPFYVNTEGEHFKTLLEERKMSKISPEEA